MSVLSVASPREIASLVPMPRLLEALDFAVSTRTRRCACVLHGGTNPTAFSWSEDGLWCCHSCGARGDKISLVRAVRKCSFREAIAFLAALAGVDLRENKPDYAAIERARQERKAEERLAHLLAETEHNLLLELADELDSLRQLHRKAGTWLAEGRSPELCWSALAFVADALPRADTAYSIAAFASPVERARFALHPELRAAMIDAALERDFVADAKGYRFEVPLQ